MKLIATLILSVSALTAQAGETQKIALPDGGCYAQAKELAKRGFNYKEIKLGSTTIVEFQTKTHYVDVSCKPADDFITISKISNAEMSAILKESSVKTNSIARQAGL